MQKLLTLVLIAIILLPLLLTGCNTTPPAETTPEVTTPKTTTPDAPVGSEINPPASTVLKRASIKTGESESEVLAGKELAAYLKKKNVEIADDAFPIIICIDPTLDNDGFMVDASLLGEKPYMTIRGGNGSGVLYGVYKFLERYAGVRYFTPELEKIPQSDIVLHDGNLLAYAPCFEYRYSNWYCAEDEDAASWNVKNGMNGNSYISDEMGGRWNYGDLFVHTIGRLTETGDGEDPNPCLSDPQNLAKTIENVRAYLEYDPTVNIVSISQNDNSEYCTCEKCAAVDKEEGSPSGLLLRFVNAVAENLEEDYPDLVIDTLAYKYTQAAPAITVPRHNVCVRVCPIHCCSAHPVNKCNGGENYSFLLDFKQWSKICDRIYLWDYTTNFRYYIPIFPNFGALRENMRFYVENSVRGMFPQGNYQATSGEFGELRVYLLAKLMWDPYMGEEEYYTHMNEFLEAYYGEGWEYIRKYIDKTAELANGNCMNIYTHPFDIIEKDEYLANEADFEAWWSAAEELAGDRAPYVKRSRLQWRYIQLMLHPDTNAAYDLYYEIYWNYQIRFAENYQYNSPPDEWFPTTP